MTAQNRPGGRSRSRSAPPRRRRAVRPRTRLTSGRDVVAGALTFAVLLAALLLAYSQFQDLFKIVSSTGVVLDAPRAVRQGTDQHGLALVLMAAAGAAG